MASKWLDGVCMAVSFDAGGAMAQCERIGDGRDRELFLHVCNIYIYIYHYHYSLLLIITILNTKT